jgi:hypothetical protein
LGSTIQVQSDPNGPTASANGLWDVYSMMHDIESRVPAGN